MKSSMLLAAVAAVGLAAAANAAIVITEAHPSGSASAANNGYTADWFEVTNTGPAAVDITGWRVDDSSNAFGSALALRGITSIPAGASVIFIESNASGTNDATLATNFINSWFGGTAPAGFQIGAYGGSGIGLSTDGDGLNLFSSAGTPITGISFGVATAGTTFDNVAGLTTVSQLSVAGVNGAYTTAAGETGSPGVIPTPGAAALMAMGGLMAIRRRRVG